MTVDGPVSCTLSSGAVTSCLALQSLRLPSHGAGPFCGGGSWGGRTAAFAAVADVAACTAPRAACNATCAPLCLQAAPAARAGAYLIPLQPWPASTLAVAAPPSAAPGAAVFGDALALNGVPLARVAPPAAEAAQAARNTFEPLDLSGGRVVAPAGVYVYAAPPTAGTACAGGWDAAGRAWAPAAPDGRHSPLLGWALDG